MTADGLPSSEAAISGAALDHLGSWLAGHVQLEKPLQAQLVAGGRSNLTYRLDSGSSSWILRRPPLGHVLATAHDMHREYRVLKALRPSPVPVPAVLAYCEDEAVLGAPFYVMELVDGTSLRTADDLAALLPEQKRDLADAFVDAFSGLHTVEPASVGLEDFGRPDGYLERQVQRWTKQLAASESRSVPGFAQLGAELGSDLPRTQRTCVVHGDPRLDNAIVDRDRPGQVLALLDWEMSTLGDPLADAALMYLYWEGWQGLDNPIAAVPAEQGFPTWDSLSARYAGATGLTLERFNWYEAFAYYKFAVICEGIHYRYTHGHTVGDGFDSIGAMVPALVERGRAALADA